MGAPEIFCGLLRWSGGGATGVWGLRGRGLLISEGGGRGLGCLHLGLRLFLEFFGLGSRLFLPLPVVRTGGALLGKLSQGLCSVSAGQGSCCVPSRN